MEQTQRERRQAWPTLCWAVCVLLVPGWASADPCLPLVKRIAAQMAAKGIKDHVLTVVPIDTEADGKVVGWCGAGTRKVVYRRGGLEKKPLATASPPGQSTPMPSRPYGPAEQAGADRVRVQLPARIAPVAPSTRTRVITECRDGLVIIQGDCPG